MRLLYKGSFHRNLIQVLGFERAEADKIAIQAAPKYRSIIQKLPEFEKVDQFKMNLVNCAFFISFVHFMEPKPTVEKLTEYYSKSMMTK